MDESLEIRFRLTLATLVIAAGAAGLALGGAAAAPITTSCAAATTMNGAGSRVLGRAAGDLDRDGRIEEVSVVASDRRPVRCRYLLFVRQGRRVRTRPLLVPDPAAAAQGYEPYLVGLAAVARGRGLEAIVDSNCCGAYVTGQWLVREASIGLSL